MTTARTRPQFPTPINLHAVPARDETSDVTRTKRQRPLPERLIDHRALLLVATALRGTVPEQWGLGVGLHILGRTILGASLVVPDDCGPGALAALKEWGVGRQVDTPTGRTPVEVVDRSAFFDSRTGLFTTCCYTGRGWLLTADTGRTLGLCADYWAPSRGFYEGGWTLGFPTWGEFEVRERNGRREWRSHLHRPPMRVKGLAGHGIIAEFLPAGKGGMLGETRVGSWDKDAPFRGRIVDLIAPAFALDGIDGRSLAPHQAAFSLPALDIPAAVDVTPENAEHLLSIVLATHGLAVAVDSEVESIDMDMRRLFSPGSLATTRMRATGIAPPLHKFLCPDDDALNQWAAASHGGWCTAEYPGTLAPSVDVDIRSAYPAGYELLDVFDLLCADHVEEIDVTTELRALIVQVAVDRETYTPILAVVDEAARRLILSKIVDERMSPLFDPQTYRDFGLCLAEVIPYGEPWPIERTGVGGKPSSMAVEPVWSDCVLPYTWPDVVLAVLLSGKAPNIVKATKLFPVGRQEGLRAQSSPVPEMVARRAQAKREGDERTARQVRVVLNAFGWGIFARVDQSPYGERLAEHSWPPIASTVSALSRMWLALVETMWAARGGRVLTRDTDGCSLVSLPEGGSVDVDGETAFAPSWSDVDTMLTPFERLNAFGDGGVFWDVERGEHGAPLHILSLAPKRYVKAASNEDRRLYVLDHTEASLGADIAPPPKMLGRNEATGRALWTDTVADGALLRAVDGGTSGRFFAPWDGEDKAPWPHVVRYVAGNPYELELAPKALGAHPFACLVEGRTNFGPGAPRTLDPGTDLTEWRTLPWYVNTAGGSLRVPVDSVCSDDMFLTNTAVLWTLADKGERWVTPKPKAKPEESGGLVVDARLIRRVGRAGVVIDVALADSEADAEASQYVYDEGELRPWIVGEVSRLGCSAFARRYNIPLRTVEGIATGRAPNPTTVAQIMATLIETPDLPPCAAEGCDVLVLRAGAMFCSSGCRRRTKEKRARAKTKSRGSQKVTEQWSTNVA